MPPQKSVCLISFSDFGLGRGEYLAKAMKAMGLDVLVVTNKPIYTKSFKSTRSSLSEDKINVIEVPLLHLSYYDVISRLVQYIFFTIFSFLILLKFRKSFDFYYSRGPQPFTDITCYVLKLFKGGKIISDTTDLWPDALEYMDMNGFLKRVLILFGHSVNSLLWSKLDKIVTHNEVMAHILSRRSGKEVHVIYGVIDLEKFKPIPKYEAIQKLPKNIREKIKDDRFIVLHAGLLGPFQSPEIILKLAKLIKDVYFVIIGTGPLKEDLKRLVDEQQITNVIFLDPVPHSMMPIVYNIADLFLLTYMSTHFLKIGLPKKFIEYSACGRPILCIAPKCVASELCNMWRAGYSVTPERIDEAVHVVLNMISNGNVRDSMGKNARKMAEALFSIEKIKEELRVILT
jgi:glycosyltransferase involved in cell wall biosynthesis